MECYLTKTYMPNQKAWLKRNGFDLWVAMCDRLMVERVYTWDDAVNTLWPCFRGTILVKTPSQLKRYIQLVAKNIEEEYRLGINGAGVDDGLQCPIEIVSGGIKMV